MRRLAALSGVLFLLMGPGCASHPTQAPPYKLPEAYANVQKVAGALVAARAWTDEDEARAAFGFNIARAGLLPVQVSFENRGDKTLVIEPAQTFLFNQKQEIFPVLGEREAYERVAVGGRAREGVKGATKGAIIGGAAGAILGTAIGVVAGGRVGEYTWRGAVMGGAAGGVVGAGAAGDPSVPLTIASDLNRRSLKNNPIKPGDMAYGVILFPREAGVPYSLRLQLKEQESGQAHNLTLLF